MKILVAIDGSEGSFNAMKSACFIADKMRSYITAFYVNKGAEYSPEETGWTSIKERLAKELANFGHEVILKAYEIGREFGVPVEGIVSEGIPSREILRFVYDHGIIKLVTMAHSSKGRGAQEFVESTTRSVVSQSRVPIFVTSTETRVKNVLVAVEDSDVSRTAVSFAGSLAKSLGAGIGIVSFIPDSEAVIEEYRLIAEVPNIEKHVEASEKTLKEMTERAISSACEALEAIDIKASSVLRKRQPEEIIAEAKNYDLLVVGIKRKESHNILGRLANKLIEKNSVNTIFVQ